MTPHFLAHIIHILESIELIQGFVEEGEKSIITDPKTYLAVLHVLQTLSESTQKLPHDIQACHENIPWRDFAYLRNAIVHDYLGDLDPRRIWGVIDTRLPALYEAMLQHIPNWESFKTNRTPPDGED